MVETVLAGAEKSTIVRSHFDAPPPPPPGAGLLGAVVRAADQLSPAWGASLAARLFTTTRRRRTPAREAAWLATAERSTLVVGSHRLAAWTWEAMGDGEGGPTVLLIHGWEGRASQLGAVASALAGAGCRAIAVDLPAHGETAGRRTNLYEMASVVEGLATRLGPLAGIVAHSFGAAATTVALRRPLDVERLVYLAPSEDFNHFTGLFGRWLGLEASLVERMQQSIERRIGIGWNELRASHLAPSMTKPLLIFHDEQDADVPASHGLTYAARWPGARLVTTRGLGHRRILRQPEVVTAVVDFLRR